MWATAAHYLNDSSECSHGLELVAEVLREESKKATGEREAAQLSAIAEAALSPFLSMCVVSLSSQGDLLSQWRAYAGNSGGFALGLNSENLRKAADTQGFYLVECLYTPAAQQEAANQLMREFREAMAASPEWGPAEQGGCVAAVMRLAMMLKDESFKEEHEWRLISRPKMVTQLEFREGASMLVPFFKFLLDEPKDAYLDSVRIGPTPHRDLSVYAVQMLLRKLGLSNADHMVTSTRATLRNW